MENTLDIIIESMTDSEWERLKLKVDSNKAHKAAKTFSDKRESDIKFGNWILKKNLVNGYDPDGSSCWVVPDGKGNTYTTVEIYNIYIYLRGDWEDVEDDDTEDMI
jgi:hypothetical protein